MNNLSNWDESTTGIRMGAAAAMRVQRSFRSHTQAACDSVSSFIGYAIAFGLVLPAYVAVVTLTLVAYALSMELHYSLTSHAGKAALGSRWRDMANAICAAGRRGGGGPEVQLGRH
jgi:enoyl-[acyl-carrier-protein] reductase (NADH)